MRLREVVAVALVLFGFAALYVRWIADAFTLNGLFVSALGVVAFLLGINYFRDGTRTTRRETPVEDVEPRYEVPVPGDETDERLSTAAGLSRTSVRNRRELAQQLRETAAETLAARGDYASEEAADEALRTGTWTDDAAAAWFLAEDGDPPLAARLRGLVGADGQFGYGARRSIDALVAARGLPVQADEDDAADSSAASSATDGSDTGSGSDAPDERGRGPGDAVPGTGTSGGGTGVETESDGATGSAASERWRLTEGRE